MWRQALEDKFTVKCKKCGKELIDISKKPNQKYYKEKCPYCKYILNENKPKSNKWYVDNAGNKCPFCLSTNISSIGYTQSDSDYAWQKIKCLHCKKAWDDLYKLVGFEEKT